MSKRIFRKTKPPKQFYNTSSDLLSLYVFYNVFHKVFSLLEEYLGERVDSKKIPKNQYPTHFWIRAAEGGPGAEGPHHKVAPDAECIL